MPLANNGDPFVAPSGQLIEQSFDTREAYVDTVETRKILPNFSGIYVRQKLSLDHLPEPDAEQQVVVTAVIGLKLMGLSDVDITEILNTSLDNIQRIIKSPAAQATFERMYQNLISANATTVQGRIAAYADKAADTVFEMMTDTETRHDVRLKAAQDVLDRSGTHPDQFFTETTQTGGNDSDELRIVIMDDAGEKERVKVDIKKG